MYDKKHYVCHSEYLRDALYHGYKLDRVHKVLKFTSEPWLKSYIENNTRLRSKATSTFEKDLWKLANNSVFGKQIENVRKRANIKLVTDEKDLLKQVQRSTFKDCMKLSDNSCLVELNRKQITLDKPIYGGMTILDYSKIWMGIFMYDYIKPKWGDNYKLLMTDTDSFIGQIFTNDFYEDIEPDVQDWFDTSNLNFIPTTNKKVPGKFKDEMGGKMITEFVGLRSKMYAIKSENETQNTNTIKKCKGLTKQAMKVINFDDYIHALDPRNKPLYTKMNIIRSKKHWNYTQRIHKKTLDPNDTKRIISNDGIHTLPLGYM